MVRKTSHIQPLLLLLRLLNNLYWPSEHFRFDHIWLMLPFFIFHWDQKHVCTWYAGWMNNWYIRLALTWTDLDMTYIIFSFTALTETAIVSKILLRWLCRNVEIIHSEIFWTHISISHRSQGKLLNFNQILDHVADHNYIAIKNITPW